MDQFDRRELERLVHLPPGRWVSIFLPTHRAGAETQQDPIRLKNLLRQASEKLARRGVGDGEIKAMLKPAEARLAEQAFWQHQREGLAVYLGEGRMETLRVPLQLDEMVVVGERVYLKPLLPLLTGDGVFFVLSLSQKQIRLYQATRHSIEEVDLVDVPTSLAEALKYDDPERMLNFRSGPTIQPGTQGTIFHGHDPKDNAKVDILRFFRAVAGKIDGMLNGRRDPLVLASVDFLQPIYRAASRYPHLLDRGVEGNPELMRVDEIHAKAWSIVHPVFKEAEEAARAKFSELGGTGQTAVELEEVLPAAHQGRVETLFVARGEQCWGRYDPMSGRTELGDGGSVGEQDLVDLAAAQTLATGGTVFAVTPDRMPTGQRAAAVLRY